MNEKKRLTKNDEQSKNEEIWLHTQNPRRFPRFTVVVDVVFFCRNPRRFTWFCFGMCLFPEENKQPIFGRSPFFRSKLTILIGRETKTHNLQTKVNEKKIAKVSPFINNYSFRIIYPFNNNNNNNNGVSLARSVELTAQWDRILAAGPLYPVTVDDLSAVRGLGIGDFHRIVSLMRLWLTAGMRPFGDGGIGLGRILWCIPVGGSLGSPVSFSSVQASF